MSVGFFEKSWFCLSESFERFQEQMYPTESREEKQSCREGKSRSPNKLKRRNIFIKCKPLKVVQQTGEKTHCAGV